MPKSRPAGQKRAVAPITATVVPERSWLDRNLIKLLVGVGALALIAAGLVIGLRGSGSTADEPQVDTPGAASEISPTTGLPIDGAGGLTAARQAPVIIDIYSDFSCPHCANFEAQNAEAILELAGDENFSVRLHPVAFLDRSGDGSGYSTRAAALLLETAHNSPAHLWAVNDALLHAQGQQMSADDVVALLAGTGADVSLDGAAQKVPLVQEFTQAAIQAGVPHIPYVLINGEVWEGRQSLLDAAHAALP